MASHRRAIYPGSFDPITNGHLDLIDRALVLFDEVIVAVAESVGKEPLFTLEDRTGMIEAVLERNARLRVVPFTGLLADLAKQQEATAIIRGLRAVSDFEFEFQMALMNRSLAPTVETIFLMPKKDYTYLSSTIIKAVATHGGEIAPYVPAIVETNLREKFKA